jgi:hypothetical protein
MTKQVTEPTEQTEQAQPTAPTETTEVTAQIGDERVEILADAVVETVLERATERLFLRTEREAKEAQALAADQEAKTIHKDEARGGGKYKVPVLNRAHEFIGYEWLDGNGKRVTAPEGEE